MKNVANTLTPNELIPGSTLERNTIHFKLAADLLRNKLIEFAERVEGLQGFEILGDDAPELHRGLKSIAREMLLAAGVHHSKNPLIGSELWRPVQEH